MHYQIESMRCRIKLIFPENRNLCDSKIIIFLPTILGVDTYRTQPKNCASNRSADEALSSVPAHFDTLSPAQPQPQLIN